MNVTKWMPGVAWDADFDVQTESGGDIDFYIQLKDFAGNNLASKGVVYLYFSDAADGNVFKDMATACDITTTSGHDDGDCLALLSTFYWMLVSEDDGTIGLALDDDATDALYANIVLPNGKVVTCSDQIKFT